MDRPHQPTSGENPPRYPKSHKSGALKPLRMPVLTTSDGQVATLDEWRDFAKRDDCIDQMVPSDLRVILSNLT